MWTVDKISRELLVIAIRFLRQDFSLIHVFMILIRGLIFEVEFGYLMMSHQTDESIDFRITFADEQSSMETFLPIVIKFC